MSNNDSLILCFIVGCVTVIACLAFLLLPDKMLATKCLDNKDVNAILCAQVMQNQFPPKERK